MKTAVPTLACGALALLFLAAGDGRAATSAAAAAALSPQEPATAPPKKPTPPVRLDYDMVKRLFGMEPSAPPADNTLTPEKVALGRLLYAEKAVWKDGSQSCATCHDLTKYGQDGLAASPGGERNAPTVLNASRQYLQFRDYRVSTVEDALVAAGHSIADDGELTARLKDKAEVAAAFQKAFGGDGAVTAANAKLALGAFVRSLTTKSKFDAFLDGDQKALSNDEKLGLKTFIEIGCITCHTTRLLGGNMPQKLGVLKPYPTKDTGRAKATGNDGEKFLFKVSPLLNVERTAPYNHDGQFKTLEETVNNMASIQLGRELKPEQTAAIVTFLKALTGPLPDAAK
jgi:cytochrome c peroxidase